MSIVKGPKFYKIIYTFLMVMQFKKYIYIYISEEYHKFYYRLTNWYATDYKNVIQTFMNQIDEIYKLQSLLHYIVNILQYFQRIVVH